LNATVGVVSFLFGAVGRVTVRYPTRKKSCSNSSQRFIRLNVVLKKLLQVKQNVK